MTTQKKKNDHPLILHLETSARKCSVALSSGSDVLTFEERMDDQGYVHAEALHVLIQTCFQRSNLSPQDLNAVHVSAGPGSYTGLRIGMSAAKGLAYALDIPLIATDTLCVLALDTLGSFPSARLCIAMQDAGRMEVYAASYGTDGKELYPSAPLILTQDFFDSLAPENVVICGDGAHKCAHFTLPLSVQLHPTQPDARQMVLPGLMSFAAEQFEDKAYTEPLYIKNFEAGKPRNLLATD